MSWKEVQLGDVCDFQNGFAFKNSLFKETGNPILRISNIQNQTIDTSKIVFFKTEDYDTDFSRYEVKPNDLLIAMSGATTGKIGFNNTNIKFYLNQRVGNLKPKESLDKKYLYYLLSTKVEENLSISKGAAQPNLSSEQIKNIELFLPPLPIQKQIVEKLDTAFAEIDKAISATQKNIKNAEALFQSYLNQIFETKSEDWQSSTIDNAFTIKPPKTEFKELSLNTEVSFMGMNQLEINQKYSIPEEIRKLEKVHRNYTYFSENDVLLAKITPCFENGKIGIAKRLKNGIGFGSSEFVVMRSKSPASNDWLYYFLLRDEFRKSGKAVMTGAVGHKRVPKDFIEKSVINFPKLKSQEYLIKNFEFMQDKTSRIKQILEDKVRNLNALKSSLLNQAFSGELTKEAA